MGEVGEVSFEECKSEGNGGEDRKVCVHAGGGGGGSKGTRRTGKGGMEGLREGS